MKPKSTKKWYKSRWAYYLYLLLLLFPMAEIATRIMGYQPYINKDYSIVSTPEDCLEADSIYGLRLVPGDFKTTMNQNHTYSVSHSAQGFRRTSYTHSSKDSVFLMGCSFTYGMGVNDNQTFTSILQKEFQKYTFINFGVPGYGTAQSLIKLREMIQNGSRPVHVILNFSKLHFDRNAMTPSYRRDLKIGYERSNSNNEELMKDSRFPYISEDDMSEIKFVDWKDIYHNWTGRETFSTINYLNIKSDHSKADKIDDYKISRHLISEINKLCKSNDINFNVCFLDVDSKVRKLMSFCKSSSIEYVNVGLTHKDPALTNLPYDSHPNFAGHQKIANTISSWIEND